MKVQFILALGCLMACLPVRAAITVIDPNYSTSVYYTHGTSDSINSFDWDGSNNIYYATTSAYQFGGLYKNGSGTPLVAGSSDFPATSVVSIGNHVYYNTSDFSNQKIYNFNSVTNTPSGGPVSTHPNYGLYNFGGSLLFTGALTLYGSNHIFYSALDGSGNLTGSLLDLGGTGSGSSGPLAFDASGNLYYAPGYGDASIYKFGAAELADAIADPLGSPLSISGNLWLNYGSLYGSFSGGTSMVFDDDGDLLLTLTNFVDPSLLVKFGVDELTGLYDNNAATILEDSGILGEVRNHEGQIYLASGNQILNVVPEPSTYALILLGLVSLGMAARRRLAGS